MAINFPGRLRKWMRILPAAGIILGMGCVTPRAAVDPPEGFAEYTKAKYYQAVTPEGVILRIRIVANDPKQTLSFWTEALKVHMQKSGYSLLEEESFGVSTGNGVAFEWIAPLSGEDWVYLTAIAVTDKHIVVAEAAGAYRYYKDYR